MEKLQAQELRIGNWVYYYNTLLFKVDGIYPPQPLKDKNYSDKWLIDIDGGALTVPLEDCSAVEITEDWLEKFGFKKDSTDWWDKEGVGLKRYTDESFLEYHYEPEIYFIHQLQNLFFSLTGEELELKSQENR